MRNPDLEDASLDARVTGPYAVIRLDGNAFSTLSKRSFERPFDQRFTACMRAATLAVVNSGAPVIFTYTQSDEISVVLDLGRTSWFGGRAYKMATIAAGYASSGFIAEAFRLGLDLGPVAFDGRLIDAGTDYTLVDRLIDWRRADAAINSTTSYARHAFGHRAIAGVGTKELRRRLVEHGTPWGALDPAVKHGEFTVRERVQGQLPDSHPHNPGGTYLRNTWKRVVAEPSVQTPAPFAD